jgi:hypothetical protein
MFSPCTNINSKWIKDVSKYLKFWNSCKKKAGNMLKHIGIGTNILNRIPMTWQLRETIEQIGLHETKKLLHGKRNCHQTEKKAYRMGENLCQLYI